MDELSFTNIMSEEEAAALFSDDIVETQDEESPDAKENTDTEKDKETTEVDPERLFDSPESVGSEDTKDKEDTDSDTGSTSPNFYSSIANALNEEGIFPDLDDETIKKVKTPEEFRDLIDQQIKAGLDERQKRIDEALSAGVEVSEVKKYENALNYLDNISNDDIEEESEKGENLRKNIIYQSYLNRGYSKERAAKEVNKSIKGGTDIDDAKDALQDNKEFFKSEYQKLVKQAKEEEKAYQEDRRKQLDNLKNSILQDKKVFGDIELDKNTRQRVFDSIAKPVFKNPDTGEYMTAIQKYEMENRIEFLKNVGLLFTLTDGFKNLDGLVKGKVRKEVKKGMRELEATLSNTARNSDGSLKFASGTDDTESWFKDYRIDL